MNKKIILAAIIVLSVINGYAQDSTKILLNAINDSIRLEVGEKPILDAVNKYYGITNDNKQKDSLYGIIRKMYPKGRVAAYSYFLNVLMGKLGPSDSPMNLKTFVDLDNRYPGTNFRVSTNQLYGLYNQIRYTYFSSFIDEDSSLTMQKVYPELTTGNDLNAVGWYLFESGKHLKLAERLAKESVEKVRMELADSIRVPKESKETWIKYNMNNYTAAMDTYAQILVAAGKNEEGLSFEQKAIDLTNMENAEMNNAFIKMLIFNKEFDKAKNFGEKIYSIGKVNKTTTILIDSVFVIQNPGKDSKDYIKSLENKSFQHQVLDIEGPSFALKDLDGKLVNSNDLKDKIVVLDFWATWCGPCKASFPGMQMAINKYRNNKNIVFLFVDTFEQFKDANQRKKSVASVIKSMELDFRVLLDEAPESNPNNYKLASQLGIASIPTKFVLKDGKIKFKLIGYGGSDEAVVEEMDRVLGYLSK